MSHKAYGFELIEDTPSVKSFRTTCDCMSPECDCWVELEYDKEDEELCMVLYTDVEPVLTHWNSCDFVTRMKNKAKLIWYIITGKSIVQNSAFIFRGWHHIRNFSDMILELGDKCRTETNELHECRKKLKRYEERYK